MIKGNEEGAEEEGAGEEGAEEERGTSRWKRKE